MGFCMGGATCQLLDLKRKVFINFHICQNFSRRHETHTNFR